MDAITALYIRLFIHHRAPLGPTVCWFVKSSPLLKRLKGQACLRRDTLIEYLARCDLRQPSMSRTTSSVRFALSGLPLKYRRVGQERQSKL